MTRPAPAFPLPLPFAALPHASPSHLVLLAVLAALLLHRLVRLLRPRPAPAPSPSPAAGYARPSSHVAASSRSFPPPPRRHSLHRRRNSSLSEIVAAVSASPPRPDNNSNNGNDNNDDDDSATAAWAREHGALHARLRDAQPHLLACAVLAALLRPVKRTLWDTLLFPLLAWLFNLLAVLFALLVSFIPAFLLVRRHPTKLCVTTTTTRAPARHPSARRGDDAVAAAEAAAAAAAAAAAVAAAAYAPQQHGSSFAAHAMADGSAAPPMATSLTATTTTTMTTTTTTTTMKKTTTIMEGASGGLPARQVAEATHLSKRRPTPSLSPYFSALMVPSALTCATTRKSLVLDLDETLVHSQLQLTEHCDLRLEIRVEAAPTTTFYVSKRPYLDVFLRTVAQWYDVVIFTASLQKYGDPLISVLDVDRVVKRRIFRQHCLRRNGNFVKDLTIVNPNLADVLIVDNSPAAYSIQPSNAVPIEPWYHDQNDEELLNLLPLLHAMAFLNDVRSLLDLRLTGGELLGRKLRKSR